MMTFFLEAAEIVHLAGDGRFGEDAGGFLEARAEMNESVESEALVMPRRATARCGAAAIGDNAIVFLAEAELVHLLLEEGTWYHQRPRLDPAHHLARIVSMCLS